MSEHIISAYSLDGNGGGRPLNIDSINQEIKNQNLTWVHLDGSHADTRDWLQEVLPNIDSIMIDALLDQEIRPRMIQMDDDMLLILRGVNLNQKADPEDMISIRLWVDKNLIISIRFRSLKIISNIEEEIIKSTGPKNTGQFIVTLVSRLFDRIGPVLLDLDDMTDDIEEQIFSQEDLDLREEILIIRKQATMLRRHMAPQKDAISALCKSSVTWLSKNNKRDLYESHNQVTRYVEDLDAIRERSHIIKDELSNIMTDKLNKNMHMLSVIAVIFLPLGFLTGLFGVNIGGVPGVKDGNAFVIFCVILTVISVTQVVLFKKLKWF